MDDGAWEDTGYGQADRWEGVIDIDCPACRVPAGSKCINPISELPRHIACVDRQKAAGR